ncbi:hypothetical protein R3P38DRAFT_615459 [Favolaschia claudopus]|uniref:Uncharacterized protein n=1 Tax=Favolaschia claudopus TaxID=2862362 RepID=A0AAW0CD61_9AGAR
MPLLQSLELSLGSPSPDAFTSCDMPMLRTAVLIDDSALTVDLPWAQLTSLSLRFAGSESFDILQKTPRLVHCDLWLRGEDYESGFIDIHLPCLESLVLFHSGRFLPVARPHPGLLDLFRVPALARLEISEYFLEPKPFETLRSFISTSASNLRHITITCRTNESSKMRSEASFRKAFPNILEFSFEFEDDAAETDSEDYESEEEFENDAAETDSAENKSEDEVDGE